MKGPERIYDALVHRAAQQPAARLVVIAHGFRGSVERMRGVIDATRAAHPDADIYLPILPYGGPRNPLVIADPVTIACDIVDAISHLITANPDGYRDIVLVGYSSGSLIVRKVAILANAELGVPFEPGMERFAAEAQPWAGRISRIVLLAGLARGWTVNSALNWSNSVTWSVGSFLGETLCGGRSFLLALRSGSPFMVQTRLQWLALTRLARLPLIIQLLGTIDDLVSPEDNVDLFIDRPGGDKFLLLEVRATGHFSMIEMAPLEAGDDDRAHRWEIYCAALTASSDEIEPLAIPRALLVDSLPEEPDPTVTDVVFVIHGIRDKGFWTQKIAREIKRASIGKFMPDGRARNVQSMTASYGYFPMIPFILPWIRARKVAWLMDRYIEAKARYPNAVFSYVGHSNGTYLVAGALRNYPAAAFHRVVLAGSVIRTDFKWRSYIDAGRVRNVLNYVATADVVVVGFPKGFQRLNLFDLGSGGHDGFEAFAVAGAPSAITAGTCVLAEPGQTAGESSYQIEFVRGGHGAGVQETQWDEIAAFVIDGTPPLDENRDFTNIRPRWLARVAAAQPIPLLGLVGLVLALVGAGWVLCWPFGLFLTTVLIVVLSKV